PDAGLRLNAALALQAVPGAAAVEALRPLLDDPNCRLRLIAARRILATDGVDKEALQAVADALLVSLPSVRKAAADLLQSVPSVAPAILGLLQERNEHETDSEVRPFLTEALQQL